MSDIVLHYSVFHRLNKDDGLKQPYSLQFGTVSQSGDGVRLDAITKFHEAWSGRKTRKKRRAKMDAGALRTAITEFKQQAPSTIDSFRSLSVSASNVLLDVVASYPQQTIAGGYIYFARYDYGHVKYLLVSLISNTNGLKLTGADKGFELELIEHLDPSVYRTISAVHLETFEEPDELCTTMHERASGELVFWKNFLAASGERSQILDTEKLLTVMEQFRDETQMPELAFREAESRLYSVVRAHSIENSELSSESVAQIFGDDLEDAWADFSNARSVPFGFVPDKETFDKRATISLRMGTFEVKLNRALDEERVDGKIEKSKLVLKILLRDESNDAAEAESFLARLAK